MVAVEKDETEASTGFTERSHGFRTEDLYVFCIGPDHVMDAHPDPKINPIDVTLSLTDKSGHRFGEQMLEKRPGRGDLRHRALMAAP